MSLDVVATAHRSMLIHHLQQPDGILQLDQFSLVTTGRYLDIYKSNTGVLCKDGVTREVCV